MEAGIYRADEMERSWHKVLGPDNLEGFKCGLKRNPFSLGPAPPYQAPWPNADSRQPTLNGSSASMGLSCYRCHQHQTSSFSMASTESRCSSGGGGASPENLVRNTCTSVTTSSSPMAEGEPRALALWHLPTVVCHPLHANVPVMPCGSFHPLYLEGGGGIFLLGPEPTLGSPRHLGKEEAWPEKQGIRKRLEEATDLN